MLSYFQKSGSFLEKGMAKEGDGMKGMKTRLKGQEPKRAPGQDWDGAAWTASAKRRNARSRPVATTRPLSSTQRTSMVSPSTRAVQMPVLARRSKRLSSLAIATRRRGSGIR